MLQICLYFMHKSTYVCIGSVYIHVYLTRASIHYSHFCLTQFELELVSVELILESESTQKSDGIPILAVNLSAILKVSDWTGKVMERGSGVRVKAEGMRGIGIKKE